MAVMKSANGMIELVIAFGVTFLANIASCGYADIRAEEPERDIAEVYGDAYDAFILLSNIATKDDLLAFTNAVRKLKSTQEVDVAFRRIMMLHYGDFQYADCDFEVDGFDFSKLANRIAWTCSECYGCKNLDGGVTELNESSIFGLRRRIVAGWDVVEKNKRIEEALKKCSALNVLGRRKLSSDRAATEEELELLSRDEDEVVRRNVASNVKTPFSVLAAMLQGDSSRTVVLCARENLQKARALKYDTDMDKGGRLLLDAISALSTDRMNIVCAFIRAKQDKRLQDAISKLFARFGNDKRMVPFRSTRKDVPNEQVTVGEKVTMAYRLIFPDSE
ncbi:hypothetical protein [Fibrobacter sp.]|uniref:hypothetical protein n=1 Tax=Fibrobacter sp. TaxID=35828 RepID=UPI00388FBC94